MDEPTSSLTPAEFERLAVLIADLAAKRRLDHLCLAQDGRGVPRLRDRDHPARRQEVVDVVMTETTESAVVARMVGRELAPAEHKALRMTEIVLDVAGLSRGTAVRDASFQASARRGARHFRPRRRRAHRAAAPLAGVDKPDGGEIRIDGKALTLGNPRAAIAAGLGLLPEERKREGIVARRSIRSNMASLDAPVFALRLRRPTGLAAGEPDADGDVEPQAARRSSGRSGSSPAATSRRRSSAAGSRPVPAFSSSTSRRAASMSAPRPRSTP